LPRLPRTSDNTLESFIVVLTTVPDRRVTAGCDGVMVLTRPPAAGPAPADLGEARQARGRRGQRDHPYARLMMRGH
jgi:hypothetical protein